MVDVSYEDLIERIEYLTKGEMIRWEYLDSKPEIYKELGLRPKLLQSRAFDTGKISLLSPPTKEFDSENSFVANINGNYMLLCVWAKKEDAPKILSERLVLMMVPRTFKGIEEYKDDENGRLVKLHSVVKTFFPSANDIISDIFTMR